MPRRKKKAKRGNEKYFDSMSACAARLDVPLARIKGAKKAGCTAFRSGRVYEKAIRAWLKVHPELAGDDVTNWPQEKIKIQTKREEIKLKKEQRRAVDFETVKFALASGQSKMFSLMDRIFTVELPPSLKGLDELGIQKKCMEANEKFKAEWRSGLLALAQAEENHTPEARHEK